MNVTRNHAVDIVIIGGGHNGLVAAFYLAKAGLKPLVLERRSMVGGAAITSELCPGFRCSTLAHSAGPVHPNIIRDMKLHQFGVERLDPETCAFAPLLDGQRLVAYVDANRTVEEISKLSQKDGERYQEFNQSIHQIGDLLRDILWRTPPSIDTPTLTDAWQFIKTSRKFRALGRTNGFRLLRWLPMSVADLLTEWFETDILKSLLAARGIYGDFRGPRSVGSGAALLLQAALSDHPVGSIHGFQGGLGALTQGMAAAAEAAGATIRNNVEVTRITVKSGQAVGVVLDDGEEIPASTVISNVDPKRTLLHLVDPANLDPNFVTKLQNIRTHGVMAKINLALDALPVFTALNTVTKTEAASALSGRIHIGPDLDYLERAFDASKYGRYSDRPYMDITIPTLTDPTLAPAGHHVLSICAQFAPYQLREGNWDQSREPFKDAVLAELRHYVPTLDQHIVGQQVLTPLDFESTYGMTGGHIFHGEHALDQLFNLRPLPSLSQYRTPMRQLYLCGAGTHPGGGVTGACGMNASREVLKDRRKRS